MKAAIISWSSSNARQVIVTPGGDRHRFVLRLREGNQQTDDQENKQQSYFHDQSFL